MMERHCSPEPAITSGTGSKAGIQYADKDNQLKYVHQDLMGMTTCMISHYGAWGQIADWFPALRAQACAGDGDSDPAEKEVCT